MFNEEVDAQPILPSASNKQGNVSSILPFIGPNFEAEIYPTNYPRRGKAIIFNHVRYENPNIAIRYGSEKDVTKLKAEFTALGFEVEVLENKKYDEIKAKLEQTASEDHKDADCLVIVVMSHGGQLHPKQEKPLFGISKRREKFADNQFILQRILAYDRTYDENELFKPFEGDKCKSLATKPKIFFIQACRGDGTNDRQQGVSYFAAARDTSGEKTESQLVVCTLPTSADFLIFRATVDGKGARRDPTPFIESLCEELAENRARKDNALDLESVFINVKRNLIGKNILQMPYVYSTLIRKLYLKPKKDAVLDA